LVKANVQYEGGSLKTVIEQDQHLPESCIHKFGTDLVNGLHHIHSLGIIFSDLKPSNVMHIVSLLTDFACATSTCALVILVVYGCDA